MLANTDDEGAAGSEDGAQTRQQRPSSVIREIGEDYIAAENEIEWTWRHGLEEVLALERDAGPE